MRQNGPRRVQLAHGRLFRARPLGLTTAGFSSGADAPIQGEVMSGTETSRTDEACDLAFRRIAHAVAQDTRGITALVDESLRIEWISPSIKTIAGHEPSSLVGTFALDLLHPDDLPLAAEMVAHELENPWMGARGLPETRPAATDIRIRTATGAWMSFEVTSMNCFADPNVRAMLCTLRDVRQQRMFDAVLERTSLGAPSAEVLEGVSSIASRSVRVDNVVAIVRRGTAVQNTLAQAGDGSRPSVFLEIGVALWADLDRLEDDECLRHDDATLPGYRPEWVPVATLRQPVVWAFPIRTPTNRETHGAILIWSEYVDGPNPFECRAIVGAARLGGIAIERSQQQQALRDAATTDALTGAPNRAAFATTIESLADEKGAWSMLSIDLDGFKQTNDTFGHHIGDALLVDVAHRIAATLRPGDSFARVGGDEFAIVCRGLTGAADAQAVADRVIQTVRAIEVVGGARVTIGASVGIAYSWSSTSAERLLQFADTALYRAKREGRNRWVAYDPTDDER